MADDLDSTRQDRYFVNLRQDWEVLHFVGAIQKARPSASRDAITLALEQCARQLQPSESREKITACVLSRL